MRLIAAVDKNWGLGYKNELQFRISSDLKRFRQYTIDGIVICGRKTLQTFPGGKPLKNRINLIMSTGATEIEGAIICKNKNEVFQILRDLFLQGYTSDQVNIIGGASIYKQFLSYCDLAILTYVYSEKEADCYFPDLESLANWNMSEQSSMYEEAGVFYEYRNYINNSPEGF